ncbi:hypothetical protein ACX0G9_13330 [Flavitalea flava]
MRTILFNLLICLSCATGAQTLTPRLTGKPQPVGPNIRFYRPSDLVITYFGLSRITRNDLHGAYEVTINVTVHNNGELPSSNLTTLKCFYSDGRGLIKPPASLPPAANDPNHGTIGPWTPCAAEPKLPIVKGGQSWGGELSFEVLYTGIDQHDKFYFIMLADFYDNSKESNEHNNYSMPIFITPPNH